jgi:hypothetical protein
MHNQSIQPDHKAAGLVAADFIVREFIKKGKYSFLGRMYCLEF